MTKLTAIPPIWIICLLISGVGLNSSYAQENTDALFIKKIFDTALTQGKSYEWLSYLSNRIGGRLSGSPQAAAAVEYTRQQLVQAGADSVWIQPVMVPYWVRGEKEQVRIINSAKMGTLQLNSLALGNSPGTGPSGLSGSVIEVFSLEELENLPDQKVKGKIIFFNRPMDPTQIRTFNAYGGAVGQRSRGPALAAEKGAIAAVVRSMTVNVDDVPHTGVTIFPEEGPKIPAVAISTRDANTLGDLLKEESIQLYIRTTCEMLEPQLSHNVIAEIKGSSQADEIILVGGHLDSWDVGGGAHDDGAGCVHAMDIIHLIKTLGYKPKRTIRCVLFMNEENGLQGALEYARVSNEREEFHLAAIESDAGGFTPRGFRLDAESSVLKEKVRKVNEWLPLLEPYGLTFGTGGSGADISRLKSQKGLLVGFMPDSQRYFDFHHTANDTIEAVNKRELEMGAAAICSLLFLIDTYGI